MSTDPANTPAALVSSVSTTHPATNSASGTITERRKPRRSTLLPYRMVNTAAMTMPGAITNT